MVESNRQLSSVENKEISEVLAMFGLRERERAVYLSLLQFREMTMTPLSRIVKLPATTVQAILNRLVDQGLVDVTKRKSRHVYFAHNPMVLRKILERRTQDVISVIPLLKKLQVEEGANPNIRVYYRERVSEILHEALNAKSKQIFEIVSADDFQKIIGEKFHFTKRRVALGVRLRSLRVEAHEIKEYSKEIHEKELREAKFLPREMTFRSSIMFWDDTVAFFTTEQEGLAWTVKSSATREVMSQLFEMLWSVSRRMETIGSST